MDVVRSSLLAICPALQPADRADRGPRRFDVCSPIHAEPVAGCPRQETMALLEHQERGRSAWLGQHWRLVTVQQTHSLDWGSAQWHGSEVGGEMWFLSRLLSELKNNIASWTGKGGNLLGIFWNFQTKVDATEIAKKSLVDWFYLFNKNEYPQQMSILYNQYFIGNCAYANFCNILCIEKLIGKQLSAAEIHFWWENYINPLEIFARSDAPILFWKSTRLWRSVVVRILKLSWI